MHNLHNHQHSEDDILPSREYKIRLWSQLVEKHHKVYKNKEITSMNILLHRKKAIFATAAIVFGVSGGFQTTYTFAQRVVDDFGHRIVKTDTTQPTPAPTMYVLEDTPYDFTQLQSEVRFPIKEPTYLPEGYTLQESSLTHSPSEGERVTLVYEGSRSIQLTQSKPATPIIINVNSDKIIHEININENPAIFYDPGGFIESPSDLQRENRSILQWTDGSYWFELTGSVGFDELVKVAESIH